MSSLEFNFNISESMAAASHSGRSPNTRNEEEKSEAETASVAASTFGFHQSTTPIVARKVNFFKTPNVNSHIISFIDAKEIASTIKHINNQAKEAAKAAIRIQLSEKKNLTLQEIIDYQHFFGLADPVEVLRLCVNQNGESNITHLDLSNSNIDDASLKRLVDKLPNLTSLNLSDCDWPSDEGLKVVAAQCPELTSLNLRRCSWFTDEGLKAVAAGGGFPNLTSLDLSDCYRIPNEGLKAIGAGGFPNLTSLNLSNCYYLTDEGLGEIVAKLPNLTSLVLSGCVELTGKGLALAALCPNLTSLALSGSRYLTDEVLKEIADGLPNLTSLNISWCTNPQATDEGLKTLVAQCPNLTTLNLAGYRLTDKGLKAIADGLPNLTSLDLSHCTQITVQGTRAALATRAGLQHIVYVGWPLHGLLLS